MSHTPEQPLQIVDSLIYRLSDDDGINTDEINVTMWEASRSLDVRAEGARRVLACVNACAGIPNGNLEAGGVLDTLLREREQLDADNASLRAALQTQAEEAAKHNAWMSQVHGLCFDLGIAPGHIEDRLFEAIGRVNMLIEQRDELLGALKLAWGFIPVGMTETDAIIKAAITKATT